LTKGDMVVHNPLDQDKLPEVEVKEGEVEQRVKATRSTFNGRLNWLSFIVDAMLPFPVISDIKCALNNKGNIIHILSLVTAFDAVVVSGASLDINNFKAFILIPDM